MSIFQIPISAFQLDISLFQLQISLFQFKISVIPKSTDICSFKRDISNLNADIRNKLVKPQTGCHYWVLFMYWFSLFQRKSQSVQEFRQPAPSVLSVLWFFYFVFSDHCLIVVFSGSCPCDHLVVFEEAGLCTVCLGLFFCLAMFWPHRSILLCFFFVFFFCLFVKNHYMLWLCRNKGFDIS